MNLRKVLFFILLLFFYTNLFANTKDILLIQSYHKGYKWSDEISSVFEKRFAEDDNIFLTTVYMDTKKISTQAYLEKLYELYKEQFKNRKFDLIVAADNNALDFLKQYHFSLFGFTPIVFLGINNFENVNLNQSLLKRISTGVVEQVDISKNIELILKMQPKMDKLVIINDRSKTGLAMKKDIFKVLRNYSKKVRYEYIDDIKIEDLRYKVQSLSENSVILWVLLFKDNTGKFFTHKESLHKIREIAEVPIYGLWDFYIDEGIVGGLLTSATAQASMAAKMAEKILKGARPTNLPIIMKSPNRYRFDYDELKRFELEIPTNVLHFDVVNKPFSFYDEYKEFVWLGGSFLLAIVTILIFLATNVVKRVNSENELKNQLQFLRVLLDTMPNPINYKNLKGEYLGCNKAFADLFGLQRQDVIGKSAFDFFSYKWAEAQRIKERKLVDTGGSVNYEQTLHLPKDKKAVMSYTKTVFKNIDGTPGGIVSVMDDITQRAQQKQFIIQQAKLAEMGEMIAAVAHQWNEPLVELSAILQDLEFSYKEGELDHESMENFVKDSMIQIQYMSKTLKDFRNFLKPSVKKVTFSAKKALDEVLEIIGKHIFYSYINLRVENIDENITVYGYENEFKQVLLNIINNAKQKILLKKKKGNIHIDIQEKDNFTRFQIMDDAGPIPDEIKNFIFDAYFTTNKEGTGLGLYMAKIIIEDKMQGKIWARNFANQVMFNIDVPKKEKTTQ